MLYSMKDLLDHALKNHYCVIAPSIRNENCMRAAIEAAEELNSPVILNCLPMSWDMDDWDRDKEAIKFQVDIARRYALGTKVPVAINRDHSKDFEGCAQAIHAGMTSVMIDCSSMSFEENVANTKEVVRMAHACGVSVEAELGHVGTQDAGLLSPSSGVKLGSPMEPESVLTRPEEIKEFVAKTGVDCVAVSIGNQHGLYSGTPHIDFELLQKLHEAVPDTPLVMHGGSGTGDENIAKAAKMGICKINVGADVEKGAWKAVVDTYKEKGIVRNPFQVEREGYKAEVKRQMKLLGSVGQAW